MALNTANPSIARVENSLKQLAAAAQALNNASDDLGKVIRHLDGALKKLALEITVWVQVNGTADETRYWASEIGYVKLDGKWCIALREVTGYLQENSEEVEQLWAFSDAPRALRAEAVDKIPDLLEKMLQQTEEATRNLTSKTEQAAEVTYMVSNLLPNIQPPAQQVWHRPAAGPNPPHHKHDAEHSVPPSPPNRFRDKESPSSPWTASPVSAPVIPPPEPKAPTPERAGIVLPTERAG